MSGKLTQATTHSNTEFPPSQINAQSPEADTVIHVHRREHGFVVIDRRTAQDSQLSWAARGLLIYLLSLPRNWKIKVSHLTAQGDAGRDAVRRMLRELQAHGYASGFQKADARAVAGRFGGSEIVIYESPDLNPFFLTNTPTPEKASTVGPTPDSPTPDSPTPEKASVYKEQSLQSTDLQNTHTTDSAHVRAGGVSGDEVSGAEEERPTRAEFERYARNNRDRSGQLLGEGWIKTAMRTGDYDAQVRRWTREQIGGDVSTFPTIEACPDCDTSGFTRESILAGAVVKCKHNSAASVAA